MFAQAYKVWDHFYHHHYYSVDMIIPNIRVIVLLAMDGVFAHRRQAKTAYQHSLGLLAPPRVFNRYLTNLKSKLHFLYTCTK